MLPPRKPGWTATNSVSNDVSHRDSNHRSSQADEADEEGYDDNRNDSAEATDQRQFQPFNPQAFFMPREPEVDHEEIERLERRELRRRKVEALESLAQSAALFANEFAAVNRRNGVHNNGAEYAVAAANIAVCTC